MINIQQQARWAHFTSWKTSSPNVSSAFQEVKNILRHSWPEKSWRPHVLLNARQYGTHYPSCKYVCHLTVGSVGDALWEGEMDEAASRVYLASAQWQQQLQQRQEEALLCGTRWYTKREWQAWKIGKHRLLEGFLGAWVPLKSCANAEECEWKIAVWSCRVASVKNACFFVFFPFFPFFSLLLSLPPSNVFAVILICPSKLSFSHSASHHLLFLTLHSLGYSSISPTCFAVSLSFSHSRPSRAAVSPA